MIVLNKIRLKEEWALLIVLLLTIVAYFPCLNADFVSWDDGGYVIDNDMIKELDLEKLKKIFTSLYWGHYQPFVHLFYAFEYWLYGLDAKWYHHMGVLLHLINIVAVYFLALKLKFSKRVAVMVAALFALTAIHVEAVAWISARKELLYVLFYILGLISYLEYVNKNKIKHLVWCFGFFLISVMFKETAVSFSLTLILLDYYLNRNWFGKKCIIEKVPFFLLSFSIGLMAIWASEDVGVVNRFLNYSVFERLALINYAFFQYIYKLFIPAGLCAVYPYPIKANGGLLWFYWASLIWLPLFAYMLYYGFKRQRVVFFGIVFFVITIFMFLQFFPVGDVVCADRYCYLPSFGLCLIASHFFYKAYDKFVKYQKPLLVLFCVYIFFQICITNAQSAKWENSLVFWSDVYEKYPAYGKASNNLGCYFFEKGDTPKAKEHFERATDRKYYMAFNNLGVLLEQENDDQGAIIQFSKAIEVRPDYVNAYKYRAILYQKMKIYGKAIDDVNVVLEYEQNNGKYYHIRGNLFFMIDSFELALKDYETAIKFNINTNDLFNNKGLTEQRLGMFENALKSYSNAIKIKPDLHDGYYNRGRVKFLKRDYIGAIEDYDRSIKLKKDFGFAYKHRGIANIKLNNKDKACQDFITSVNLGLQLSDEIFRYCNSSN